MTIQRKNSPNAQDSKDLISTEGLPFLRRRRRKYCNIQENYSSPMNGRDVNKLITVIMIFQKRQKTLSSRSLYIYLQSGRRRLC